jgi:hypothetical protein
MGNQKPMYYSNGSFCDQKVVFEDWESKFTPGSWDSSSQFETLRECCVAHFYYDIEGCIAASPKELTFSFSFTLNEMIVPLNCQDADIQGKALETAIDVGLGSSSTSQVTGIDCVTLSNDPDTDNTICGGCLSGSYLGDDFDGTRDGGYYSNTASATITVDVTTKSPDCQDAACFQSLYNEIISDFTTFIGSGQLTTEIISWAQARVPPIPELWNSQADTNSFSTTGSYNDPFNDPDGAIAATTLTATGTLSVVGLPTITTSSEKKEATAYFESAIESALKEQGVLPDGAVITVTGFTSGAVQYEVTLSAASSTDANTSISNISTSLSQTSTLSSITTAVQTESSGGTLSMVTLSVSSNTAGSTSEVEAIKATTTGSLTTSMSTTGLTPAEVDEVEAYFEDAITEKLQVDGVLPTGSFVTVTGITDGVVEYEITMYTDPSTDVGSIASSIDSTLSQTSTLNAISDAVTSESSGVVEGTSITTSGELSVSGLSISTTADETEATAYFTTAITDTLTAKGVFPDGATVTVTGVTNGAVQYEITVSADTSTDATTAVSQINSSLAQSSTLTSIKDLAVNKSTSGTLSLASLSVNSNTAGASVESTVSKVTSTGSFATTLSTTGLTSDNIAEIATVFEDSITSELTTQGLLPAGSYVTITGMSNGVVSYEITMYNDPGADSNSIVSSIDSALGQTATQSAIQTSVSSSSSTGSSSVTSALSALTVSSFTSGDTTGIANTGGAASALSSLSVTGFTAGETAGITANLWYPKFDSDDGGCSNNGFEAPYMKESPDYYLFSSKKECCDEWFSYDPFCATSASTEEKFYPDLSTGVCGVKQEKEFESHETARYDTLEQCCSLFPYSYDDCCNTPGLGGCEIVGVVMYIPDWSNSVCYARSESSLADHEVITAFSSASDCCGSLFGWRKSQCCKAAGGC